MVTWVWFCEGRKLSACFPVELAAVNDNAADSSTVSADELCCGVDNDVCAVIERSYEVRCSECAVNNERDLVLVSDLCNLFNVDKVRVRVAESFDVKCLCVVLNCLFKVIFIIGINECCCDAIFGKCVCEEVVSTAVDSVCCYDVVACLSKVLNGVCNCCCAGSNCESCNAAFKSSYSLLEDILSWVCKSAVDVACVTKTESVGSVFGVMENVRRCEVNRNCSCVSCGVCFFLSNVKLKCFKLKISFL